MKKKLIIILFVIVIGIAIAMLYQTFATSSSVSSGDSNVYNITLSGTTEEVTIPANSSKTIIYQITNTNKGVVQYGVMYKGDNITIKVYDDSIDTSIGTIDYGENKFVKLIVTNSGTTDSTASIKSVLGYENGGSLESIVPNGYTLVKGIYCTGTAVECITSAYLSAKDDIVSNNNIEYQYASTVSLMNDRLGGTTDDYDAGNIRYYGANPNNYVDIGDRDSNGNVIPYRIIGVFKDMTVVNDDGTTETQDLIKVIRADSIGTYAWDNKTNGIGSSLSDYGSNDWSDARLMMLLNPGYDKDAEGNLYSSTNPLLDSSGNTIYGYEGSLWWNSKSGICYSGSSNGTKTCDFTSTGLSSDVQNKIEEVVWNLGGNNVSDVYSNVMYTAERGTTVYKDISTGLERPTEWIGKVALMYSSDYGYATDFNSCSSTLYIYRTGCYNTDWLYMTGANQWQLTPRSIGSYYACDVVSGGHVVGTVSGVLGVRPVFYLDSDLVFDAVGDGTKDNPYRLGYDYVEFTVTPENRSMIGYTDETTDLVIPSTFQGEDGTWYKVNAIGDNAFLDLEFNNVILSDSVTYIGFDAFGGANFSADTFKLPKDFTYFAGFSGAHIDYLIVPNTVTYNSVIIGADTDVDTICYGGTEEEWNSFGLDGLMSEEFNVQTILYNCDGS